MVQLSIYFMDKGEKRLQKEIDQNTVAIIISTIEQNRTAKEVKVIIIAVDMFVSMVLVCIIICSAYSGQERLWRECYKGHFLSVTLTMGLK